MRMRLHVLLDFHNWFVWGAYKTETGQNIFYTSLQPGKITLTVKTIKTPIYQRVYRRVMKAGGLEQLIPPVVLDTKDGVSANDLCKRIVTDLLHAQPLSRFSGQQVVEDTLRRYAKGPCVYGEFINHEPFTPTQITIPDIQPQAPWAF
ncbi:hypothetical protein RU820_06085 [Acidithiobacillus ferrooxidans]|uniref:Uncharacterized protein n=1 Tax=Acidithiobacillus ferrooxidans (strain ATCC 23270 / DSM 14882 / CIP 104768 / NCIMB 8455) TaxID=243159 RepID=B7J8W0_ACIF2|nr:MULTISPECIES: hypothetical protein [Acidithiobacillus]ACK80466.1 hypothetical protein AFE_1278 [Acidithiobacillus ferrooxidans ATCC 23270]MBN6744322.1 hypothetical protein [Acidithiobacillus sp. MC2.2]MBN6747281.1 hypothetical protein [Acidithiobacillus sp. PG05]